MGKRSLWAAALVTSIVLAGCAGTTNEGKPTVAQEPKRLEQKVFITMGDYFFADASGTKGGTFRVSAEKTVGIHIQNDGAMLHEVMFGRGVAYEDGTPDGFEVSLFEDVAADVFVFDPVKIEVATEHGLSELEIDADGELWIRAKFPAEMKGEWEIACFVPGHFESGMKATLVIE